MKNATYVHKCSKYCKDGRDSIIRVLAGTHCRQMGVIASVHVAKKICLHKLFFRLKDTKEQVFFQRSKLFKLLPVFTHNVTTFGISQSNSYVNIWVLYIKTVF